MSLYLAWRDHVGIQYNVFHIQRTANCNGDKSLFRFRRGRALLAENRSFQPFGLLGEVADYRTELLGYQACDEIDDEMMQGTVGVKRERKAGYISLTFLASSRTSNREALHKEAGGVICSNGSTIINQKKE